MKIVIIPAFFRTKKNPTLGNFFWEQAIALREYGHEVIVLYCDTFSIKKKSDYIRYQENEELLDNGIMIYRSKRFCLLKHGLDGYRHTFEKGIQELYEKYILYSTGKIDIIHAHCAVWAGTAAMHLSQSYNIPYIITEHATLYQLYPEKISKRNNKIIEDCFRKANKTICVSEGLKRVILKYTEDIEVVGNIVDCNYFRLPDENVKAEKKFTFFSLCYMQTEQQLLKKGIDVLIHAVKLLQNINIEFEIKIGGGGSALPIAQEWVKQSDVEDKICFLGALDREQVVIQMQECDCFVLPSRYETFGVVYIEAMACGKPVIGVKNGGPDSFVNNSNGILLEQLDAENLADTMQYIVKNKGKFNSRIIREDVKTQFSQESIAKKLTEIYQKVVKCG